MRPTFLAVAAAAALFVIGCGSSSDDATLSENAGPPPTETATLAPGVTATPTVDTSGDQALAESLLLTIDDLPTGWSIAPPGEDETHPAFERCDVADDTTGRAESGTISRGTNVEIGHTVTVYETVEEAAQDVTEYIEDRLPCLVEVINSGDVRDDEFAFGDASLAQVSFLAYGDESALYRLSATVEVKEQDASVDVFYEMLVLRTGRIATSLQVFDVLSPYSGLEQWAEIVAAKLEAAAIE